MLLRFLVLGSAISTVCLAANTAPAGPVINLLPLGDSITAQAQYSVPLITDLTMAHYTPNLLPNEGYSGYVIDGSITGDTRPGMGLAENTAGGGLEGSPTGTDFLAQPGVNATNTDILLMIGTNDVDTGFDLTPGTTDPTHGNIVVDPAARMAHLISDIRTEDPLAHLIVAQIVPNLGAGKDPAVQAFNAEIASLVAGLHDSHVSLVNMYSAFESHAGFQANPYVLMTDTLHPNATGGAVMAGVWAAGIEGVPEPSSVVLLALGGAGILLLAVRRHGAARG